MKRKVKVTSHPAAGRHGLPADDKRVFVTLDWPKYAETYLLPPDKAKALIAKHTG